MVKNKHRVVVVNDDDDAADAEEYVEDLEPLDSSNNNKEDQRKNPKKQKDVAPVAAERSTVTSSSPTSSPTSSSSNNRRGSKNRPRKFKTGGEERGPDYRWESNPDYRWESSNCNHPDYRWESNSKASVDSIPQNNRRSSSRSSGSNNNNNNNNKGRRKMSRSKSFESIDMCEFKRHSTWDGSSSVVIKGAPDFRWDKAKGKVLHDGSSSKNRKKGEQPQRKIERTRSDNTHTRGGLGGRVKFCLSSNVFFEIPRASKEMKPELFYSKREIKEFKAENRERKLLRKDMEQRQRKQQQQQEKGQVENRQQNAKEVMLKLQAQVTTATTRFSSRSALPPIATC